jgi:hypothetical protein
VSLLNHEHLQGSFLAQDQFKTEKKISKGRQTEVANRFDPRKVTGDNKLADELVS